MKKIEKMKKVVFFVIEKSDDNIKKIVDKHPYILEEVEKFFFKKGVDFEKQEIELKCEFIIFDNKLAKQLINLLESSKKELIKISQFPIGKEKNPKGTHSVIYSTIQKAIYQNPKSIFNFVAEIFSKLLIGHKLTDGNKRISLSFLIASLNFFGYQLFWSGYKDYEMFLKTIIKKLEKRYNELGVNWVADWIKINSIIAI